MVKPAVWLNGVEALEEQLEAVKLAAWRLPRRLGARSVGIVQSTAGLLKGQIFPGRIYERRIRLAWERAARQRAS